jgi:methylenetetrahydrofolate dehydrogenase (NADP+)/methenyltetrahydrofolate cyclohydrolase
MAIVLDGKLLSQSTEKNLSKRVRLIRERTKIVPTLAAILVGSDPASATYVRMKGNACARIGIDSLKIELSENTSTSQLIEEISKLNKNENVHGILLQHPVPKQINERKCFDSISLEKDVDGVTCLGFGNMSMGEAAYGSCTATGIMRLLKHYKIDISGKHAVVVGRSPILGKPMSMMLLNENATVTVCHSKTKDLADHVRQAEILVGAVGLPRFIKSDWIKQNSVVIDAGYHPEKCGDIDLHNIESKCFAFTPVPGGVGPMTINTLLLQTVEACERSVEK